MNSFSTIACLMGLLLISGCKYLSELPPEEVYVIQEEQACEIDPVALGNIFLEEIPAEINCLESKFDTFKTSVRRKTPGKVSRYEVDRAITTFFPDDEQDTKETMDIVYPILNLTFQEKDDSFPIALVPETIKILRLLNRHVPYIRESFEKEFSESKDFWQHQASIAKHARILANGLNESIQAINDKGITLDINNLMEMIHDYIDDVSLSDRTREEIRIFKRFVVGGEKKTLTLTQLQRTISVLSDLVPIAYNLAHARKDYFEKEAYYFNFLRVEVLKFQSKILIDSETPLLEQKDILQAVKRVYEGEYDVDAFENALEVVKEKFIGGNKKYYNSEDLKVLIGHVNDLLISIAFNDYSYELNKSILDLDKPTGFALDSFDSSPFSFMGLSQEKLKENWQVFANVANKFRFYHTNNGYQYFTDRWLRNKPGFIRMILTRWMSEKVISAYGITPQNSQTKVLSVDNVSQVLLDLKPTLIELKLWSASFENFARNTLLLGDLFQTQSNGDTYIGLDEATEYLGLVSTAMKMGSEFTKEVAKRCDSLSDDEIVIDVHCYRPFFFDLFLNQLGHKEYVTRLNDYVTTSSEKEISTFLSSMEVFAKDVPEPEYPMRERDFILLIGALLNVESTLIRFDHDKDNILSPTELDDAFLVYRDSIIALAELDEGSEKYARSLFFYMVHKMKLPTPRQLFTYHYFSRKKVYAKRLNIGNLLYYLLLAAEEAQTNN